MRYLVHTYIKTLLIVYVKLKFNWCPVFYQATLLPKATVSLSVGLVGHFGGMGMRGLQRGHSHTGIQGYPLDPTGTPTGSPSCKGVVSSFRRLQAS